LLPNQFVTFIVQLLSFEKDEIYGDTQDAIKISKINQLKEEGNKYFNEKTIQTRM